MRRFTSFQIKLILGIVLAIILIIGAFLFFMNSMSTINRDINITKIESKDKVYTYDVYSDFYFNIVKYNEKGENIAQFSEFIPLKTSIGYDLSKEDPELILKTYDNSNSLQLIANKGTEISKEIDSIKSFSKEYSLISAIQDEYYFKENSKRVKEILENLYDVKTKLSIESVDNFYEDVIPTDIRNLYIKIPKLNEIKANLKSSENCKNEDWCSSIASWEFGESDIVSFEYVTRVKNIDLDDFLGEQDNNVTITKFTKINNKKVSKFFMLIPADKNEIRSFFMDSNGYVYLLRYKYKNPKSLEKYKNDYIKIAFGINFIDATNFENKYAKIQDDFYVFKDELKKVNELDSELIKTGLYEHFGLKVNSTNSDNLKLEDIYDIYKNNVNYIESIRNEYTDKFLIKEALQEKKFLDTLSYVILPIHSLVYEYFDNKKAISKLKESCNSIECIKELKSNDWKVKKNNEENN